MRPGPGLATGGKAARAVSAVPAGKVTRPLANIFALGMPVR